MLSLENNIYHNRILHDRVLCSHDERSLLRRAILAWKLSRCVLQLINHHESSSLSAGAIRQILNAHLAAAACMDRKLPIVELTRQSLAPRSLERKQHTSNSNKRQAELRQHGKRCKRATHCHIAPFALATIPAECLRPRALHTHILHAEMFHCTLHEA